MRAAGIVVDDLDAPESWAELVNAAGVINRFEGARSHRERYERFGGRIGARLAELVRAGLEMPDAEYQRAGEVVKRERIAMQRMFREYPAILTPAAMGAPPEGYESTGDPVHNAPWTALGVPAIGVPMRGKRPAGMQITAAWDRDGALLAMARQVSEILVS
jgi:Asp-tRNA(Asn)/Glu-tRNA(Gln) amidotransferase A subunit family amidase